MPRRVGRTGRRARSLPAPRGARVGARVRAIDTYGMKRERAEERLEVAACSPAFQVAYTRVRIPMPQRLSVVTTSRHYRQWYNFSFTRSCIIPIWLMNSERIRTVVFVRIVETPNSVIRKCHI